MNVLLVLDSLAKMQPRNNNADIYENGDDAKKGVIMTQLSRLRSAGTLFVYVYLMCFLFLYSTYK